MKTFVPSRACTALVRYALIAKGCHSCRHMRSMKVPQMA